jgi:hypothetical protein
MASEQPKKPVTVITSEPSLPQVVLEHDASLDSVGHEQHIEAEEVPITQLALAVTLARTGC